MVAQPREWPKILGKCVWYGLVRPLSLKKWPISPSGWGAQFFTLLQMFQDKLRRTRLLLKQHASWVCSTLGISAIRSNQYWSKVGGSFKLELLFLPVFQNKGGSACRGQFFQGITFWEVWYTPRVTGTPQAFPVGLEFESRLSGSLTGQFPSPPKNRWSSSFFKFGLS